MPHKANSGSFRKGEHSSISTEFKKGVFLMEKHPFWKGGRVNTFGYVLVRKPEHQSANLSGYILEHRMIMEEHIGRKLNKNEIVHHINGIRDDNRIENLFLCSNNAEHRRLHVIRKWSKNHECCIKCGSTKRKHEARGLCTYCYLKTFIKKSKEVGGK